MIRSLRSIASVVVPLATLSFVPGCGLTCSQARIDSIDHMNKGVEAAKDKHYEVAQQELKTATTIDPANEQAYWNLSQVYFQQKKWQDEADALGRAIELDNDDWAYHWYLGDAYRELKKWDMAETELAKALQLNPKLFQAEYHLGLVEEHLDKPRDAAVHFTNACKTNPRAPFAFLDLAQLYLRWDYVDQALAVMGAASQNNPDNPDVHYVYGSVYDSKGDYQKAIEEYSKCRELSQGDSYAAAFQLGMDYAQIGDRKDAIAALKDFQRLASGKPDAADTLDAASAELYLLSGP